MNSHTFRTKLCGRVHRPEKYRGRYRRGDPKNVCHAIPVLNWAMKGTELVGAMMNGCRKGRVETIKIHEIRVCVFIKKKA